MKKTFKAGFLLCLLFFAAASIPSGLCAGEGWQRELARRLLTQAIPPGSAVYWHLDYGGFAVKVPQGLMIFDYSDDEPVEQQK